MALGEFRLRVEYRKAGRARFLSHLEVMRAQERSARRAQLAYAVTQGFSPRMKVAFGPALPVGTAGEHEYFDLWLTEYVSVDQVLARLKDATPEDLAPTAVGYVGQGESSLSAGITLAVYEAFVRSEEVDPGKLGAALDAVIASGRLAVERKGKTRIFDLAQCLPKGTSVSSEGITIVTQMTIRMGQEGSLRPEALMRAALERIGAPDVAVQVTRVDVLIEEDGATRRPL